MVTMRSPGSMSCDSAFSNVVLPEPVPPEIRMLRRLRAAIFSTVAMGGEMLFCWVITSSVMPFLENLRIEIEGPSIASGGMMILTRLPSMRRASTSGVVSSTPRPICATQHTAIFYHWEDSQVGQEGVSQG